MNGTVAQSGTLADSANVAKGMGVVYDYYGAKGFFADSTGKNRKINWAYKDDALRPRPHHPPRGRDPRQRARLHHLDPGHAEHHEGVRQHQRPLCSRTCSQSSGHPAWGDPVNHPWTTGSIFAYNTEAVLWGSFIEQHLDRVPGAAR